MCGVLALSSQQVVEFCYAALNQWSNLSESPRFKDESIIVDRHVTETDNRKWDLLTTSSAGQITWKC